MKKRIASATAGEPNHGCLLLYRAQNPRGGTHARGDNRERGKREDSKLRLRGTRGSGIIMRRNVGTVCTARPKECTRITMRATREDTS